jgi:hypothetical protein
MSPFAALGRVCFAKTASSSSSAAARSFRLASVSSPSRRGLASLGDQLPSVDLHLGFPPTKHNLADFAKDKAILLVGLPGAFTPT